ncbi:hypothetical protein OF83DRAFT_295944 [Amylostereum chailletii]|nr:hypothetical protein OF83DRAFT_295944 [Amylostereum chailletii]
MRCSCRCCVRTEETRMPSWVSSLFFRFRDHRLTSTFPILPPSDALPGATRLLASSASPLNLHFDFHHLANLTYPSHYPYPVTDDPKRALPELVEKPPLACPRCLTRPSEPSHPPARSPVPVLDVQ